MFRPLTPGDRELYYHYVDLFYHSDAVESPVPRENYEATFNELMRSCGFTYAECEAEGIMLPVVHAEVDYRAPAHYDDVLELTSWVKELRGVRIEIACEVRRKGEDRVLASGFTRHCFVSSSTFRPVPPPERLVAAIG